jgi:GTP-binding protein
MQPNLGVVTADSDTFTVADVPGLVPGASEGRGLGLEFLRHVERCAVLVHVVDCATMEPDRDPASDIEAVEAELAHYTPSLPTDLADKPRLVVLNKIDVPEARELAEFVADDLLSRGHRVLMVSCASHEGLDGLRYALAGLVAGDRAARPAAPAPRMVLRPAAVDGGAFSVEPDEELPGGFVVHGEKPERWIRQTDFTNAEAVGYLADRLARLGVEARLAEMGAEPGVAVTLGGVTFDWEPSASAGTDDIPSARGTDPRLDASHRTTAAERKARHRMRRGLPVGADGPDGAPRGRGARR